MKKSPKTLLKIASICLSVEAILFFISIIWSLFRKDFLDVFLFGILSMMAFSKANKVILKYKLMEINNEKKKNSMQ